MNDTAVQSEYMLFFRGGGWDKGLSPEQLQETMARVLGWFDGLQNGGRIKGGQPLGATGRVISAKEKGVVADGPFVESKEAVGGYLLLLATDLDEAVRIAKSCPMLQCGASLEVRPVVEECPTFERAKAQLASAMA